ncbi:MAG TPA: hypothetical protein DCQ51_06160 [Planktothrix sp. UBA8407]|jgi:hypothetical protein|nr:hypothetical protein [Planktothrix sp. UBA8402]HAO10751.1 hypothetical protein [Planktothrix sp. UBA8407]HBK21627.1 hypothetical protein [Planktothrix sp. UBA10369]
MQYYFTAFIVIFFIACYGYSYLIVKLAKQKGEEFLLFGMLFGLFGFMAFCAASVPFLHWLLD